MDREVWQRFGRSLAVAVLVVVVTQPGKESVQAQSSTGTTPLADAARAGNLVVVQALLAGATDGATGRNQNDGASEVGALNLNQAHADGMTGLHWAAFNGDIEMVRLLIAAEAEMASGTRLGNHTPLHMAAKEGHGKVVELLVNAGADVEARTSTGAVPLHFAAAAGDLTAVEALLEAGAETDAREPEWEQTPLHFAAARGRTEAVGALLEAGADWAITARVMDLVERDIVDRKSERQRRAEIAFKRGDGTVGAPSAKPITQVGRGNQAAEAAREALEARQRTGEPVPLNFAGLVGTYGGLSAMHLAAREGHAATVNVLLDKGAEIDLPSAADGTTPILIAAINGYFDLVAELLRKGANPNLASVAGATPLYAVLNTYWAPKARHPQPLVYQQQEIGYLELMRELLEAGADVNARLTRTLWYTTYNRDLLGVDRTGATPLWRAVHATDLPAMKLLLEYGADPSLPTIKTPQRQFGSQERTDHSGLPPVPVGGPAVYPIHAAAGVGYGQGFAGNSHRHAPDGWMPVMRFLVEELDADVNQRDLNGYTPVHHAAARGDNEMILYLVEHGADVTAIARNGQTTADMANGPVQRIQPFPATVALLERLGAKNNHRCVSC